MTTSGTVTFSRNRDQLIKAAARKLGVIEAGETPDASMVTDFAEALNAMVKHWQATGLYIWTMEEGVLFLQASQTKYTLGSGTTDHIAYASDMVQTTLTADAANGAGTISVDSITDIASADKIGVQLDDGTFHWTTVNGAPSGSTVTLTAALGDSASSGAVVVAYTTDIVRPLKIVSARRYRFDSGIDTPIMIEDRESYFELPLKAGTGVPNILFYDRRGGKNSTGLAYFWQSQSAPTDCIKFTFQRPIEDFSAAGDDCDLPQEWIQAITFNLALNMAPEYDVPLAKFQQISLFASKYLTEVQWNERELEAIEFAPDMRR